MNAMSLSRLRELLDAYGAESAHWPAHERDAALALIFASQPARALWHSAQALDSALDQWLPAAPDAALSARILAQLPIARGAWRSQLAQLWSDLGGWRLAGPAFAASLALGALLPLLSGDSQRDLPDEDLIAAVQFIDEPLE